MYITSPFDNVVDEPAQTSLAPKKLTRSVKVLDCLLLPFGRAVKSDLQKIGLTAVSTDGFYLSTDVSVITIRKSERRPLCLADFDEHFGNFPDDVADDDIGMLNFICTTIKSHNPRMTPHEELFLDLYFGTLKALTYAAHDPDDNEFQETCGRIGVSWLGLKRFKAPSDVWRALLPIPEMQMYVYDPLATTVTNQPNINFRVDYGFWDGEQLHAVEIDGSEPDGYARDIRRDRLLQNAGLNVIHILNVELAKHRGRALQKLLPQKFFGHSWDFEGQRPDIIPF
jgi:hypothetical protein